MKLSMVLQRIPVWYASRKCFYLKSAPGIGKTTTIEAAPRILAEAFPGKRFGIRTVNGTTLTPMDTLGFGVPKHTETHSVMVFTLPNFWITDEGKFLDEYDGGIIYVDEADKMDVDIKKVIGEGALSGRFGPHKLPPGWVVWMSGNRDTDRSGSTKELDHLINRICYVDITPDPESWRMWAEEHGTTAVTIAFAMNNPQIVWADKLPEKQGSYCTARSLVQWDDFLRTVEQVMGEVPDSDTMLEECSGFIGVDAASQYFVTLRMDREMPSYEDMIKNPKTCRVPDRVDAQMLVCYKLASRVTKEDAAAVVTYVDRMPKDFAATFARNAIKRDPMLVTTPAFIKWAMNNSALLTLISKYKK